MPLDPQVIRTLLERLKEKANLVAPPTMGDIASRIGLSLAEADCGPPPRSIMYYGGVIKFAERFIASNLSALGVKTKARGDVLDRMRQAWRRGK